MIKNEKQKFKAQIQKVLFNYRISDIGILTLIAKNAESLLLEILAPEITSTDFNPLLQIG